MNKLYLLIIIVGISLVIPLPSATQFILAEKNDDWKESEPDPSKETPDPATKDIGDDIPKKKKIKEKEECGKRMDCDIKPENNESKKESNESKNSESKSESKNKENENKENEKSKSENNENSKSENNEHHKTDSIKGNILLKIKVITQRTGELQLCVMNSDDNSRCKLVDKDEKPPEIFKFEISKKFFKVDGKSNGKYSVDVNYHDHHGYGKGKIDFNKKTESVTVEMNIQ